MAHGAGELWYMLLNDSMQLKPCMLLFTHILLSLELRTSFPCLGSDLGFSRN